MLSLVHLEALVVQIVDVLAVHDFWQGVVLPLVVVE